MRTPIELNSVHYVERFTQSIQTVYVDVGLVGKDENGNDLLRVQKGHLLSYQRICQRVTIGSEVFYGVKSKTPTVFCVHQ